MGNILFNQFRDKLAKKNSKDSALGTSSIKIDFNDFTNKRNQAFVSCLSKYLKDTKIRKSILQINRYTVKFGSFLKNSDYGTQSAFHVTLSLLDLSDDGRELWECILYECDDLSENEVKSASFDNGQIAVKYFVNEITNLYKN
jgi:hypothetical protein